MENNIIIIGYDNVFNTINPQDFGIEAPENFENPVLMDNILLVDVRITLKWIYPEILVFHKDSGFMIRMRTLIKSIGCLSILAEKSQLQVKFFTSIPFFEKKYKNFDFYRDKSGFYFYYPQSLLNKEGDNGSR